LRLGQGTEADRQRARELPDLPMTRALRYALGDEVEPGREKLLYCAASRIRHPRGDDPRTSKRYGELGPDGPSCARYAWGTDDKKDYSTLIVESAPMNGADEELIAVSRHSYADPNRAWYHRRFMCGTDAGVIAFFGSLLPSDPEALFAEGARAIGNNLYDWEASWHDKAYLEPLLDPTVALGDMAILVLVCGLLVKEPGQSALAVDCLVQSYRDGRLDPERLAATHSRLSLTGLARLARFRKALDAALRIEPHLDEVAVSVIEHLAQAIRGDVPKDFAKLLELLNELCVGSGRKPSPACLQALREMKLGGASAPLRKKLLLL